MPSPEGFQKMIESRVKIDYDLVDPSSDDLPVYVDGRAVEYHYDRTTGRIDRQGEHVDIPPLLQRIAEQKAREYFEKLRERPANDQERH